MIAYITSIGEPTTDLCKWALERNGFEVELVNNQFTSLAEKLRTIYFSAEEDFLRVDADVIVNKNMTPELVKRLSIKFPDIWWWQFLIFDWYKQDIGHQPSFIRKPALSTLKKNIGTFMYDLRPETECSRVEEFYNPRRFETYKDVVTGIHGYGIKKLEPVMKLKQERGQTDNYDFEMVARLNKIGYWP
jgi:hypothetical protein